MGGQGSASSDFATSDHGFSHNALPNLQSKQSRLSATWKSDKQSNGNWTFGPLPACPLLTFSNIVYGVTFPIYLLFAMHPIAAGQRPSFFPSADAAVLQTKHEPPLATSRPTAVAPILDVEHADQALSSYTDDFAQDVYPTRVDIFAPAPIPPRPEDLAKWGADRYLFPVLTRNERLRLTMLFYYTRGALEDTELQSRLLEKVHLARETVGWEFVIAGLLSHNTYTRMVTVGLPLAVLPRRESTCAHTVNQPPGVGATSHALSLFRFISPVVGNRMTEPLPYPTDSILALQHGRRLAL